MMNLVRAAMIVVAVAGAAGAAVAQVEEETFESLWERATAMPHTITERDGFTMVETGDAFYYFTKEGHYAHPSVVRRGLAERNGRFFVDTQGWSFAAEPGQPGFKRWLEEFMALNRQMMEALEQQQQQSD
jgi:hypothetical protein